MVCGNVYLFLTALNDSERILAKGLPLICEFLSEDVQFLHLSS